MRELNIKGLAMDDFDFVYELTSSRYCRDTYRIFKNVTNLSKQEMIDLMDPYNFGGEVYDGFAVVYTD